MARKVSESGLSRHAVRTWERLAEAGPGGVGVAELSAAVGFRRSTVFGHLKGLAELGLAEDHESVWRATGPVEGMVACEGVRASAGSVS
ncbi:helix-turn-helix domain-containing protein [Streptomyces sp. NPDC054766]|uniref:helix-turn-helix domain-containing protein n=1 Tax=Streptomyces rhizosphaerihabitans TaxID=1266770 RepID=UPI0021C21258|nr:helix-turn-helix domain-containing protein [Streptomyces rhizosphaerihabitans]MCT9007063.1 helix-turn-helix domain-containing protein [Streptomyces rhizosphaerihabitans]